MVLASRSTTMRRAGAFLALVAFEVGAVVILHRLGELPWLRVPFGDLGGWLRTSAPEDVLAAVVRLVALGAAWWLLGSTALYVLARLSRIPGAIRALELVTLPSVRRLADQAIALTLATSIMSGGANAALANPAGMPTRPESVVATHDPLTTWARASALGYRPAPSTTDPPAYQPEAAGSGAGQAKPGEAKPGYQPEAAGRGGGATTPGAGAGSTSTSSTSSTSSTTSSSTTSSTRPPTTTSPPSPSTSTTGPPTTRPPARSPYIPRAAGTTPSSTRPPAPAAPRYTPSPAGPPHGQPPAPLPETPPGKGEAGLHHVAEGDSLWTIARDRLAKVRGRPADELSEREIARYWLDLVDANRSSLRSGDPDLIFPGEILKLPPVARHEP